MFYFLRIFFFIFIYLCSNLKSFPSPELFIKTKRQDEDKSEHPGKWQGGCMPYNMNTHKQFMVNYDSGTVIQLICKYHQISLLLGLKMHNTRLKNPGVIITILLINSVLTKFKFVTNIFGSSSSVLNQNWSFKKCLEESSFNIEVEINNSNRYNRFQNFTAFALLWHTLLALKVDWKCLKQSYKIKL